MKTGKLAQLLGGISPQTVNNWSERPELEPFLSPSARKIGVSQRDYNASDRVLMNTVRQLRQDDPNISWEEVAAKLKTGFREAQFPASATTVDGIVPMEVMTSSAMAIVERDQALARVGGLEAELTALQQKLDQAQQEAAKALEAAQQRWIEAEMERAGRRQEAEMERAARLHERIGQLKALLKQAGINFDETL